jgi:hypothetical protein
MEAKQRGMVSTKEIESMRTMLRMGDFTDKVGDSTTGAVTR